MKEEHKEKAITILQQLKGLRIGEAQELLQYCSDFLMTHPVGELHCNSED